MGYSVKGTIKCNMSCKYCYEGVARQENADAGKQDGYNVDKIIKFVEEHERNMGGVAPNLHGGEPLLLPKASNEKLLRYFFSKFGETSIQTNGLLIDDEYIEMFRKFKTQVGVSIDGPGELNLGRWMGNEEKTLKAADKIMANMKRLKDADVEVAIIAVVSKKNATADKLPILKKWLLDLKEMGITAGRLNMIQVDFEDQKNEFELSTEEERHFYSEMSKFLRENGLRYAPFTDVLNGLLGYGHKTCVTTGCDPYHTEGEQPIYGDGTQGNCLRTAKDGVVYLAEFNLKGDKRVSNERYSILRQIPMDEGGCGGCRFWNICTAHCPADGEDGDWRNKTRHCASYKTLYEETEKHLKQTMPRIKLISDMTAEMSDYEFTQLKAEGKLFEKVFATMHSRRGAF